MTSTITVTGASGFLGSYVVAAALRAGHTVRALVRPGTQEADLPWGPAPGLRLVRGDLRRRDGLESALDGSDAVVHLAAVKSGDFASRFAGTVVATENLLGAMDSVGARRLIHCSTFAVYDYQALEPGSALTERSPLETRPDLRDEYAQVKLAQERLVREWDGLTTVVRPGMIYGPDELWHALLGVELPGGLWVGVGSRRRLPMTWVENVADAFVAAVEAPSSVGETVNIVDDNLPSVRQYLSAAAPHVSDAPRMLRVPYPVMRGGVAAIGRFNDRCLRGRAKLPSGLLPAPFAARFRPLDYPNQHAKDVLSWRPRFDLQQALARSVRGTDLLRVVP